MEPTVLALPALDAQLAKLVMVVSVLLLPLGALGVLLLYKVSKLLGAVLELVTVARFDIYPMVKDLRALTHHAEALIGKLHTLADATEDTLAALKPKVAEGGQTLLGWWHTLGQASKVLGKGLAGMVAK
jgi:hypothetical protein